jgi:hypothetical protein
MSTYVTLGMMRPDSAEQSNLPPAELVFARPKLAPVVVDTPPAAALMPVVSPRVSQSQPAATKQSSVPAQQREQRPTQALSKSQRSSNEPASSAPVGVPSRRESVRDSSQVADLARSPSSIGATSSNAGLKRAPSSTNSQHLLHREWNL